MLPKEKSFGNLENLHNLRTTNLREQQYFMVKNKYCTKGQREEKKLLHRIPRNIYLPS